MDWWVVAAPWLLLLVACAAAAAIWWLWWQLRSARARLDAQGPHPMLDDDGRRVLAVLRSAAIVVGADGEVMSASPPAYSLGLVRADEITQPAILDLVAQVRATGGIIDTEMELARALPVAGAAHMMLRVRVAPIGGGRILVLPEDRTEAHRLEIIRRDFVVNVSHELKTPVAAMALLAETMADAADDPEAVRKFSAQMQLEAKRLSALVGEIIELSRLQATGLLSDVKTVHLADVIDEAVSRERTAAAAKNITVSTAGARDLLVYGDQELLVTAVRNLVDNAVAYSPRNTRVGIGVREVAGMVEIAVVDQGIGIAQAEQGRVFERFYRTDPARSRVEGGTGLGLSIVKHIAADHGGEVSLWSAPGRGSTFTLRIPAADVTSEIPLVRAANTPWSA